MTPLIIGHRGFPARFPDNSLVGVQAALAVGADGVEVDVRPCADGVWVCHHDRERGGVPVLRWPMADLRAAGVPTLATAAGAVPADRLLYVEVKPLALEILADHEEALVEPLRRRGGALRIISSSLTILDLLAAAMPGIARSWVIDELPDTIPQGIEVSPKHTLVESLIDCGRPLHPWTVNFAGRMRQLARLGVASITTNRPDLAMEVLRG